jgi:TolB-like protein
MEPAGPARVERRLAAILAADVAGYSRLIERDEEGTLSRLKGLRAGLIDPKIAEHKGRIVKTTGDGVLVEFASVVDALRCAAEIQAAMAESNAPLPPNRRIDFRIGIHQGDIVVEDGDIFGDGVNVAARLEGLAEPGGICVSSRVQEDAAGRLDLAFEDIGEQSLKNITRPVRAFRVVTGQKPVPEPALALPDKPSIAVLPFANMSGDPEQEYFADGMVEEIITALSRIRRLFVIARNSTFTYKGKAVDVKQVGRELGVRYVLEGSVRKGGGRVRITAQLIDAETGAHLWAERFDGSLEDVFDLQDQVASSVAAVIEPTLEGAEVRRSRERPTQDFTAYDLYLRALPNHLSFDRNQMTQALDLLGRAIERDPRFAPALALAAWHHHQIDVGGWSEDREANRRAGIELARRALQVGGDDPSVLAPVAHTLASLGEDLNGALALIDRALTLNPNFARGWYWSGILQYYAGQPALSLEHFEKYLRLSPRDRWPAYLAGIGIALFLCRRFDEAAVKLQAALQELPSFTQIYRYLAACYAHMGRLDEARELVKRLRLITPAVVTDFSRFQNPEDRELILSGLRLAAGEAE